MEAIPGPALNYAVQGVILTMTQEQEILKLAISM